LAGFGSALAYSKKQERVKKTFFKTYWRPIYFAKVKNAKDFLKSDVVL
jgi:glycogen debranching enzyme